MNRLNCAYALVGVVVLLIAIGFPKWIADDAYISFRYAENLVKHGELTFNAGEDPVEGYTGVLFPLGIAMAMRAGISPELMVHCVGLLSLFLLLVAFHGILKLVLASERLRLLFFFLFATAPFLYTHVFSGLQTITFMAILLLSSLQLHSLVKTNSSSFSRHSYLALSLLVLSLSRPEGVAYAAIVCGVLFFGTIQRSTARRVFVLSFVSSLLFPGTLYFIWRWQYYGFPLPNTFYAKHASSLSAESLHDLAEFCLQYLLLPALLVATSFLFSRRGSSRLSLRERIRSSPKADRLMLGSLLLFCAVIVPLYMRTHLFMNFSFRFYAPLYPVAMVTLAWLISPAALPFRANTNSRPWRRRSVLLVAGVMYLLQVMFHANWLLNKEIPSAAEYDTRLTEMARAAGRYLRQQVPGTQWLVVHYDAGAIPFYSRLKTIDFGALNDEYLAHHKNSPIKDRVDYFFSKRPGAAVFTSYDWERVDHGPEASAIISDPRFHAYKLARKFGNSTGKRYYEFVFLRNDLLAEH